MIKKLKLKSKKRFIPVNKPYVSSDDIKSVNKVLKKAWISSDGPEVEIFEKKFSKKVNRKYSVAVSNGTAALEIAVKALGIKKGDEVIIPNFTIISNAISVIKQNAKPVLIDCDINTWNINADDIEKKITKKTKALMVTHIYSFSNDMDKIVKICKKNNIYLIEDSAEVIGLRYKKKPCGSFGDISTFSFYANKQITTGEGGMISTNNPTLRDKCKSLRNLCFGKKNRFNHDDIGWNYRMTNIQATLGINQLKRINKIVKTRHNVGLQFYQRLKNNKNIYIPEPKKNYAKNIYWVIAILIIKKNIRLDAKKVMDKLNKFGIGTRPFFWPMHRQNILKNLKLYNSKQFKNSEYISKYGFYLPSSLSLKKTEIDFICQKVNLIFK